MLVVVENPDRFAIRLTEQNSSIGLFAVMESQCTEDEHDDEDDSKFRNLGLKHRLSAAVQLGRASGTAELHFPLLGHPPGSRRMHLSTVAIVETRA